MDYQLCIISYFDILGMKQLLKAGNKADEVAEILLLFRTFSDIDQGSKDLYGWRFVNFSDLAVRAVPIYSEANKNYRIGLMYHEVTDICNLQANLINRGILVRGCMTVGNLVAEQGLIFGEGLARAYIQESTKARVPRIIIDHRLMDMFRALYLMRSHRTFAEEWRYIRPNLLKDDDGYWFLHYLNYVRENEKPQRYLKFLEQHKQVIIEKRRDLRGDKRTKEYKSRREKIEWLRNYHDYHVDMSTEETIHTYDPTLDRNKLMFDPDVHRWGD